ncbi:polysaccharide deacetylase family protein [bacterium]|nr:polysaccharide deacetylase family protein [bacterium]
MKQLPYLSFLVLLPTLAHGWPIMNSSSQRLTLRFASAAEANLAKLSFAPVYDDREWALSARWDDSNPNSLVMREHMARYGLKGTFYLTGTDPQGRLGEQFARDLMRDGFSIGGHTQTHPSLTMVPPNEIWQQIMANRIEREAQTDTPINSFAFPNGRYRSDTDPQAMADITAALERAGYFHCVYTDFVRNNPHLKQAEWTTGWQVVPGDKVVDAAKFQENLDKILRFKDTYQTTSHCIFLGVHAWQQGEEWPKFDAVLQTLTDRNWWICNQTEWAAYSRQAREATCRQEETAAAQPAREYTITRPVAAELGAAVPLTVVVQGAAPQQALCEGQPVTIEQRGGRAIINLPAGQEGAPPAKIDHVAVEAGSQEYVVSKDFPGLRFRMQLQPRGEQPGLTLQWQPAPELTGVAVSCRLPLRYLQSGGAGLPTAEGSRLEQPLARFPLQERPDLERYRSGPEYFVVQFDFTSQWGPGRIYVTTQADVDG